MTNTKHDEEIKELVAYMLKLKDEAKMTLPEFRNSDLHDRRQKYYKTLTLLVENNTKLANENENLRYGLVHVKENLELCSSQSDKKSFLDHLHRAYVAANNELVKIK